MADYYYSPTVLTSPVFLTDVQAAAINLTTGGEADPTGEKENVLDGLANGRQPLTQYYVTFEQGWDDGRGADELIDWHDINLEEMEAEEGPEYVAEFRRLLGIEQHEFLREVLKVNPELPVLELQTGFTCSRIQIDGYGGRGLHVNRKGYFYISTDDVEIDEDGTITLGSKFTPWKKESDGQAEAT